MAGTRNAPRPWAERMAVPLALVAGLAISYFFHWDAPEALAAGALRNTFALCAVASLACATARPPVSVLPAPPPLAPPRRPFRGRRSLRTPGPSPRR